MESLIGNDGMISSQILRTVENLKIIYYIISMIDYSILAESVIFYENRGYDQIEVPWIVPRAFDDITRPGKKSPILVGEDSSLVGSAEQSFIYLLSRGILKPGQYQAITPCFRDDVEDLLHLKQFMKNELIKTDKVNNDQLTSMVTMALDFVHAYNKEASIIETESGFDIVLGDIELGSYGIREHYNLKWIYGTGCALPRMQVI